MPRSVLDAIKLGIWNFDLTEEEQRNQDVPPTAAMPGSREKVDILATRLRQGLPLWHPSDRLSYDEATDE